MMKTPRDRRLTRLDMKLLIIFQQAMLSGHVKIVAANLGLTQSAVSHALRRLSDIVEADLFIRGQGAIIPTERAREIAPAVDSILATARSILPDFAPGHVDPALS